MEVVASLSQGRIAAAQCGLFTHKSVPVIFEPPCTTLRHTNAVKVLCSSLPFKHFYISKTSQNNENNDQSGNIRLQQG